MCNGGLRPIAAMLHTEVEDRLAGAARPPLARGSSLGRRGLNTTDEGMVEKGLMDGVDKI